jgi:predicted ATPase
MPREAALIVGEGEFAGPSPSADARLMVVDAVTELLETLCSDGPVILVLEDLHWADESSLGAVQTILHDLAHVPLLLMATLLRSPF